MTRKRPHRPSQDRMTAHDRHTLLLRHRFDRAQDSFERAAERAKELLEKENPPRSTVNRLLDSMEDAIDAARKNARRAMDYISVDHMTRDLKSLMRKLSRR